MPELAIVPLELFDAAQARCARLGGPRSGGAELGRRRPPKHLLSGLLTCASCGASMIIVGGDRVGCSAHQNKGTCDNRRSIRLAEIEARVVAALKSYLLAPDLVAEAVEAYRLERSRLAKERAKQRRNSERDLAAIDRKIAGVIAMGEKGGDPRALALRLNELEAERRALLAQMPPGKETDAIALHPNSTERYRRKVADVHAALTKGDEASREAITWSGSLLSASQ